MIDEIGEYEGPQAVAYAGNEEEKSTFNQLDDDKRSQADRIATQGNNIESLA